MSKKKTKGASAEASVKEEETSSEVLSAESDSVDALVEEDNVSPKYKVLEKKERDALKEKAKEIANKEAKQQVEDAFLKEEVEKAKKEAEERFLLEKTADQKKYLHTINLSSAADHIRIGNKVYKHGQTYEFTQGELSAIKDMEFRGHEQERVRKGQNKNEYGLRERDGIQSGSGVVRA